MCGVIYSKVQQAHQIPSPSKPQKPSAFIVVLLLFGASIAAATAYKIDVVRQQKRADEQRARDAQAAELATQKAAAEKRKLEDEARAKAAATMNEAISALKALEVKWNDAYSVADATPRIALSGPLASMQAIRRETQSMDVPECLVPAKEKFTEGMNLEIEGVSAFMTDRYNGESLAIVNHRTAKEAFDAYHAAISNCNPSN